MYSQILSAVHGNHPFSLYFSIYLKAYRRRFRIVIILNYVHLYCLWYNACFIQLHLLNQFKPVRNTSFNGVRCFFQQPLRSSFRHRLLTDPDSICTVFPHLPSDLSLLTDRHRLNKRLNLKPCKANRWKIFCDCFWITLFLCLYNTISFDNCQVFLWYSH